jgi:hypothetical protein
MAAAAQVGRPQQDPAAQYVHTTILAARTFSGPAVLTGSGYFTILLIGFLLWIAYGLAAGIPALVIPDSVALLVAVAVVIVTLRLRHRSGGKRSP